MSAAGFGGSFPSRCWRDPENKGRISPRAQEAPRTWLSLRGKVFYKVLHPTQQGLDIRAHVVWSCDRVSHLTAGPPCSFLPAGGPTAQICAIPLGSHSLLCLFAFQFIHRKQNVNFSSLAARTSSVEHVHPCREDPWVLMASGPLLKFCCCLYACPFLLILLNRCKPSCWRSAAPQTWGQHHSMSPAGFGGPCRLRGGRLGLPSRCWASFRSG